MKKIVAIVALTMGLMASAFADPIGYPGSAWFVMQSPASPSSGERHDTLYQGKIEQGIDWFFLDDAQKFRFNTFVSLAATADSAGLGYYNKAAPALGMKISYAAGKNTIVDFGIQNTTERRWVDGTTGSATQVFINVWSGWNLK